MREKNHFRQNRIKIQQTLLDSGFLKVLTESDLPLEIIESKAVIGAKKLRTIFIDDIPVSDDIRPKTWLIDLEFSKPILATPQNTKTAEKALIILGSDGLYVFMFEMKNTLMPSGDDGILGIKTKFEHTIARILVLLPIYIFNRDFNDYDVFFKGVVCFNDDTSLKQAIQNNTADQRNELITAFKGQNSITLGNYLTGNHKIDVFFLKNPTNNPEEFDISFKTFFKEDWEYQVVCDGELTCPILKPLPEF
jgi:hypothetical protein